MDDKKLDEALCSLNAEIIALKKSREYVLGTKILKFIYAIKHLKLSALLVGWNHSRVNKFSKKISIPNNCVFKKNDQAFTNKKIAVYTCITGNYDKPIEPIFRSDKIDYFIVTDMQISADSAWRKIDINDIKEVQSFDNTRKARFAKTHPHLFFKDYEYSIWVDSNFKVVGNLSKFISCVGEQVPFASNWHPQRNCIFAECEVCVARGKDDPSTLRKQVDFYKKEGMPAGFGLIETNMIVRKHNDVLCKELMENWWDEMTRWSKRDQLSLPYVIWKKGLSMESLGFICSEIRENTSVQVLLHESKYKCPVK